MLQDLARPEGPINLAVVPPFRLGEVEVYPSTRQLVHDGKSETLEPRVMQVLVALAEAQGAVLGRDELIERCWGGRIVSENAINRVISRIRQVAADFGMDSFQLETITQAGYRMIVSGAASASAPPPPLVAPLDPGATKPITRRLIVGGGLAVAGALGAGFFLWKGKLGHQASPEARELFRRGELAQRQGLPDQNRQAVSFFEQAVADRPAIRRCRRRAPNFRSRRA